MYSTLSVYGMNVATFILVYGDSCKAAGDAYDNAGMAGHMNTCWLCCHHYQIFPAVTLFLRFPCSVSVRLAKWTAFSQNGGLLLGFKE